MRFKPFKAKVIREYDNGQYFVNVNKYVVIAKDGTKYIIQTNSEYQENQEIKVLKKNNPYQIEDSPKDYVPSYLV